jgi:hypothetical protein
MKYLPMIVYGMFGVASLVRLYRNNAIKTFSAFNWKSACCRRIKACLVFECDGTRWYYPNMREFRLCSCTAYGYAEYHVAKTIAKLVGHELSYYNHNDLRVYIYDCTGYTDNDLAELFEIGSSRYELLAMVDDDTNRYIDYICDVFDHMDDSIEVVDKWPMFRRN